MTVQCTQNEEPDRIADPAIAIWSEFVASWPATDRLRALQSIAARVHGAIDVPNLVSISKWGAL